MNQSVHYRERPDWRSFYRAYAAGGLLFLLLAQAGNAGAGLVVLLLTAAYAAIGRQRREYSITDDAVIVREGLLSRNVREIRIRHIRGLTVLQNPLERLLGVGTLVAVTASESEASVVLRGIRDPGAVKDLLSKRIG